MNILWTSLVEFPPISKYLGKQPPAHCGWLYSSAKSLIEISNDYNLGVLVYSYGRTFDKIEIEGITYYLIPTKSMKKTDKKQISFCKKAIEDFNPDIIHIHGTEYSLAEAVCKANKKKIVSIANIQGLANPYTRYADGGLTLKDKLFNITPLDFYRNTFIFNARRNFRKRAKCERYILNNVNHVIGRTQWDHDHVKAINPELNYHFMNETLRDSFYEPPFWDYSSCEKHTIFVSNSGSPLKGAHQVLKALPLILKKYPDTKVRFCGSSVLNNDIRSILKMQGYHLYLRKLVKKLNLQDNVEFLGNLSEEEMKKEFLKANVYVLPSAIENSPNSLCESQILGVPCISSYVGGVSDLVKNKETGFLYRYEEYEMLGNLVIKLFNQNDYKSLNESEREIALIRHNQKNNATRLKEIYNKILSNGVTRN